jgi:glycosyltransferase involved in cell wall biosynthesis
MEPMMRLQEIADKRRNDAHARGAHTARRIAGDAPLRVALIVEAAGGGVAVHLADLIEGLASRGVDVHLIGPRGARFETTILNAEVLARCKSVVRVPMQRSVSWRDMISFVHVYRALARIDPDIVHAHSSKAGVLARLCFGRWQKIYTPHAVYTLNPYLAAGARRFYGTIESLFGRMFSERIIAVSGDEARHLQSELGIPVERIETIYNGVPTYERLPRDAARDALGLRTDAFVVGVVGRIEFQKGVDRLVRLAQRLESKVGERLQFALIGGGDIRKATGVAPNRLPSTIRYAGHVVDARRYFAGFDAYALPSRYEGFPYVYLEAMAAQLPIVTTRVAGAEDLVANERIGLVVENDDDMREFEAALTLLLEDSNLRSSMAANCARSVERYSAQRMVERTLEVYRSVITEAVR